MQAFIDLWKGFRLLPSAWLLLMQFFILVLSLLSHHATYRVLIWMLGVVVLPVSYTHLRAHET